MHRPVDCTRRMCLHSLWIALLLPRYPLARTCPILLWPTMTLSMPCCRTRHRRISLSLSPSLPLNFPAPAGPRAFPCDVCCVCGVATASDSNYCNHTIPSTSGHVGRPKTVTKLANQLVPMKWKLFECSFAGAAI